MKKPSMQIFGSYQYVPEVLEEEQRVERGKLRHRRISAEPTNEMVDCRDLLHCELTRDPLELRIEAFIRLNPGNAFVVYKKAILDAPKNQKRLIIAELIPQALRKLKAEGALNGHVLKGLRGTFEVLAREGRPVADEILSAVS